MIAELICHHSIIHISFRKHALPLLNLGNPLGSFQLDCLCQHLAHTLSKNVILPMKCIILLTSVTSYKSTDTFNTFFVKQNWKKFLN